jgi:ribosomal protein S18 acetylase RimI-like enzyme
VIIRPIRPDERSRFVAIDQSRVLEAHLNEAFASGAASERWCLVAEENGRWLGRVFLRGPADVGEIFVHFFDVALDKADADRTAQVLIEAALDAPESDDPRTVLFALDEEHPWHPEPARRHGWFRKAGFEPVRRTRRWEWPHTAAAPRDSGRLAFRRLDQVGEVAFRDAVARVSEGTLDRRLQEGPARLGREADAAEHLRRLASLDHQPDWLQTAYDADENLVGLFTMGTAVGAAFITFVGVVPERRGRGYVDDLVARATRVLLAAQERTIRADTDIANEPMAKAFVRAGFVNFMTRTEYVVNAEQRRRATAPPNSSSTDQEQSPQNPLKSRRRVSEL